MSETKELKKKIQTQLKAVKPLLPRGFSKVIMAEYGISQSFYYDIIKGRGWDLEISERILKELNPKKIFDIKNCNPVIEWDESLTRREIKYKLRDEIKELKPLLKRGIPREIAKQFDVPESMVYDLMEGRSWHLEVAIDLLKKCKINKARTDYLEIEFGKIILEKEKTTSS